MTTSKIKFVALLMLIASVFVLTSCKKKKSDNISTPDVQSETDNSAMEEETSSLASFADAGGDSLARSGGIWWIPSCATVTVDTTPGYKTITIDFGTAGCLCHDGRTRKGKIIITFTRPWWLHQPLDSAIVTLNNYYVDDVKHEGTRYFIIQDSITLHIVAVNCSAVFPDGTARSWNCDRYRKWIDGTTTPYDYRDDVFELSGIADGTNRKGRHFTISTRPGNPLVRRMDCRWLVSGILDIIPDNLSTRSIDWGNGNCDDIVTVTVDGKTITIHLR